MRGPALGLPVGRSRVARRGGESARRGSGRTSRRPKAVSARGGCRRGGTPTSGGGSTPPGRGTPSRSRVTHHGLLRSEVPDVACVRRRREADDGAHRDARESSRASALAGLFDSRRTERTPGPAGAPGDVTEGPLVDAEPQMLVRLRGVQSLVLQHVRPELVHEADPAPLVSGGVRRARPSVPRRRSCGTRAETGPAGRAGASRARHPSGSPNACGPGRPHHRRSGRDTGRRGRSPPTRTRGRPTRPVRRRQSEARDLDRDGDGPGTGVLRSRLAHPSNAAVGGGLAPLRVEGPPWRDACSGSSLRSR